MRGIRPSQRDVAALAGRPSEAAAPASALSTARSQDPDGERTFWSSFLLRIEREEPAAIVQLTRIIGATISRMGAFELRSSWADISQEVLLAVIESVRRRALDDPSAFVAYTQTITRRRVHRWLELRGRLPAAWTGADPPESELAWHPDPGLRVDLMRAMAELPPLCLRVLEHTHFQGQSYEEAALALELSVRQVKRLKSRGLKLLREALGTA